MTALRPALEAAGGSWVGWDGGGEGVPERVPGLAVDLIPVRLTRREVDSYYQGFSNRTLWPLLHSFIEQPVFDRAWWRVYRGANERFAAAAPPTADALFWVHDYHLMLAPGFLRARYPNADIRFFLHVPFPAAELFARLPWRDEILEGLLGADVVAFHTEEYRDNFVRTCARLRDDVAIDHDGAVAVGGRRVLTAAHPISIDARGFAERARGGGTERCLRPLLRQFGNRRVLLGVDRLDYTKGIVERLRAIELLLEERSELRGRITFVQIAVPSRGEVREYRQLRRQVDEAVGRINGRFTDPGADVPVYYLHRNVPRDRLLAYYRLADVCLVTPLRDGMNLVAKEFVVTQGAAGRSGVLVLSEFAGAAEQLRGALLCNPFDLEEVADTIQLALELPEDDRRERLLRMERVVHEGDVFTWAKRELAEIPAVREPSLAAG